MSRALCVLVIPGQTVLINIPSPATASEIALVIFRIVILARLVGIFRLVGLVPAPPATFTIRPHFFFFM